MTEYLSDGWLQCDRINVNIEVSDMRSRSIMLKTAQNGHLIMNKERGKSDLTWINVFFKFGNVIIQAHVNVLDCKNQPLTEVLFN